MRIARLACLAALAALILPAAASAKSKPSYLVGMAARSMNPTAEEIASGQVYLGGFGFGPERAADGILGEGASVRAFVVSDGKHPLAIADLEAQGWFVAQKDAPYGLVDMRK